MISLTSIITAIKGASIATKIGLSVGAVVVVVGGTVGTVMIINNTNKTPENQQIASEDQNDDNSPSEQNSTQNEDTGEPEDDKDKTDQNNQPVDESKPNDTNINNGSQATTQKPNSNTSNQSTSNNYSASKPSNSTPAQPSQPSQPTQPAKKPDYNLNDKYVAGYYTYPIFTYDPNGPDLQKCKVVEEKAFLELVSSRVPLVYMQWLIRNFWLTQNRKVMMITQIVEEWVLDYQ